MQKKKKKKKWKKRKANNNIKYDTVQYGKNKEQNYMIDLL